MAKKESKKEKNIGFLVVGIISILALLIGIGAFFLPSPYGDWDCVQTVCSKYMDETEIAAQVCSVTDNGEFCSLNVDGNQAIVPRDQLNFSTLQFCKEEVCVKEVKTRVTNYTFKKD